MRLVLTLIGAATAIVGGVGKALESNPQLSWKEAAALAGVGLVAYARSFFLDLKAEDIEKFIGGIGKPPAVAVDPTVPPDPAA